MLGYGPGEMTVPSVAPARLGRFTVSRRLGAGGMAEVFLARSRGAEGIDKLLVVKRILPAFAQNPDFRAMFVEEARVALRLNHPNVVQVYGFEQDGPTLLLIMEHVDGPDLGLVGATATRRGERVPPTLAAWIIREVARGVHYAHDRRDEHGHPLEIVHRDVSPSNVLLSYDGAVKLGDFGIARARSASDDGAVKGKFGYMAPEQARGETVDRRADVYSIGVIFAELLSGRPLIRDGGHEALDRLRRNEIPGLDEALADAPEALATVVRRCIQADRTLRYPTAREISDALGRYLHDLDEAVDATAVEHYLARMVPPRVTTVPPPALGAFPSGLQRVLRDPDAGLRDSNENRPTLDNNPVIEVPDERNLPRGSEHPTLAAPRTGRLADLVAALRERVHVAVVVGRVLPARGRTSDSRAFRALLESLAYKADAVLAHARGDGFTIVVGAAHPHADHGLRAARLALDILDAANALDAEATHELTVSLGLARGVASCARDSEGALVSYEVVDDAIPLATSLAAAARPGEALVAGGLYRTARRAFVLQESSFRPTGGNRAWVLQRMKSRAERARDADAGATGLAGREDALGALAAEFTTTTRSGVGRGALIVGELGIGKSALMGAFAQQVGRTTGARIVRADAAFGAAGASWALLSQIVRQVVPWLGVVKGGVAGIAVPFDLALVTAVDRASAPVGPGTHAASRVGRRAALRALRVCTGLEQDETGAEPVTLREVGLVLRRMLAEVAVSGPVVVLADAMESADRQSRAVLTELCRKPPNAAVLVVLAVRDDDPIARDLRALPAVALGPLDAEARRRLVAGAFGAEDAADDLVRAVAAAAGGNPLMILEVAEALAERDHVRVATNAEGAPVVEFASPRDGDLPLPVTVEGVLAARLEALPSEARALLRWCALLGEGSEVAGEASTALLDRLSGEDGAHTRARLVADGILATTPDGATVAFAHSALARVASASIDPTARPAMHARIADCLDGTAAARGEGAAVLALHREASGDDRLAARAWLAAAEARRQASRDREALAAYGRLLTLCRGYVDGEAYVLRFAAHLGREDIARGLGKASARRAEVQALRSVAAESREPRLMARALARQARYRVETSQGIGDAIERDVAAAVRAARRAGDARVEAEALRVLAVHLGQQGRSAEALLATDEALVALARPEALAAPPGREAREGVGAERALRVAVLFARGSILRQTGSASGALGVYADAFALALGGATRRQLAQALDELAGAALAQDLAADALRLCLASIAVDREGGHRERLGTTLLHAGQALAVMGQGDRALGFLRRAVSAAEVVGGAAVTAAEARVEIAELLLERGDIEGAVAEMEIARTGAGCRGSRYVLLRVCVGDARVHVARRQWRQARLAAEAAERVAREAGMAAWVLHGRVLAAESALGQGDRMAAKRYVDTALTDPLLAVPGRLERSAKVIAGCVRVLRTLGDNVRADEVATWGPRTQVADVRAIGTADTLPVKGEGEAAGR